jgi:hypothetical protein
VARLIKGYLYNLRNSELTNAVVVGELPGEIGIIALSSTDGDKEVAFALAKEKCEQGDGALGDLQQLILVGDPSKIEREWGFGWKPLKDIKSGLTRFLEETS